MSGRVLAVHRTSQPAGPRHGHQLAQPLVGAHDPEFWIGQEDLDRGRARAPDGGQLIGGRCGRDRRSRRAARRRSRFRRPRSSVRPRSRPSTSRSPARGLVKDSAVVVPPRAGCRRGRSWRRPSGAYADRPRRAARNSRCVEPAVGAGGGRSPIAATLPPLITRSALAVPPGVTTVPPVTAEMFTGRARRPAARTRAARSPPDAARPDDRPRHQKSLDDFGLACRVWQLPVPGPQLKHRQVGLPAGPIAPTLAALPIAAAGVDVVALITSSSSMPACSSLESVVAWSKTGPSALCACRSLEIVSGANPCAIAFRATRYAKLPIAVADVEEHPAFARADRLRKHPLARAQDAALVAVEAVRHDVALAQARQKPGQPWPHVDHVDHQRQAELVGGLPRQPERGLRVISRPSDSRAEP